MPPGLASVVSQTQGTFTVFLAMFMLRERPTRRQLAGMIAGLTGLVTIGLTVGHGLTMIGLVLVLASAVSWSIGYVLLKRLPPVDMLHLVVWMSVVPPLPALALSSLLDGPLALPKALAGASRFAVGATLYLGVIATVVAYAIWARLLHLCSAAVVTPFALLAPCVGALSSAIVFGEQFGPLRLAGMAMILFGLAIVLLRLGRIASFQIPRARVRDE